MGETRATGEAPGRGLAGAGPAAGAVRIAACAAALLLLAAGTSPAQEAGPPGLDWGPHGVGFRLIEAIDSTRAFRAKRDFEGRPAESTARPVRIALWYPARPDPDAPRMSALELRVLRESEIDLRERSAEERAAFGARTLESAVGFGVPEAVARARLETTTPAVRDAPPAPGPHPTVVHVGAAYVSDPLTPAYLASHGFVVAAVPNNGRMTATSIEFSPNPLTLDTGIDDLGFACAALRRERLADTDRLAVYAFSTPSLHGLLWVMRDLQADAIVSVEGWERYRRGADLVRTSPHYDPLRIRVPVLLLERAAAETSPRYSKVPDVVDSLAYASRIRVAFDTAEHGDFLSHAMDEGSPDRERIYAASMRIVRAFLEAALVERSVPAPPEDVEGLHSATASRPAVVAPSEEELFRLAEVDPAAFAEAVAGLRARGLERPPFREHVLARAARFAASPEESAILWRTIVDVHPASATSRFRLGESLAGAGRTAEAREAMEEAIERLPADPDLDAEAREAWLERIEAALEEAGG